MATTYSGYRAQRSGFNATPVGGPAPTPAVPDSQPNPTRGTASRANRAVPAMHTTSGSGGMVRNNSARARARKRAEQADIAIGEAVANYADVVQESQLGSFVRREFEMMRRHRDTLGVSERLIHCLRAFNGEYSPTQLHDIKKLGGSEAFARLTAVKARTLMALLSELYLGNERPWELSPTPTPSLPDDVTEAIDTLIAAEQTAKRAANTAETPPGAAPLPLPDAGGSEAEEERRDELLADAMRAAKEKAAVEARAAADALDDELVEGGFYGALTQFIAHFATFPLGILKGPFYQAKKRVRYVGGQPQVVTETRQAFSAPSPFDVWFSPGVHSPSDGNVIERIRFAAQDLERLADDSTADTIRSVLAAHPDGFVEAFTSSVENARREEEARESPLLNETGLYDVLEFHGWVRGDVLLGDPLTAALTVPGSTDPLDPLKHYHCTIRILSSAVLSAHLNPDPLERAIYHTASFEPVPGSVYGRGLPEALVDTQGLANAALRALINNIAFACLPGDTIVYRQPRAGKKRLKAQREVTLDELWAQKHRPNSGLRRNVLRALDETTGKFIAQRVKDIHYNGEQDVFAVTTKAGYRIEATHNHRFMSADGQWRTLGQFAPGDFIAVNGADRPLAERRTGIRESHPTVDLAALPPTAVMTPEQAVVDHEAHVARTLVQGNVLLLPGTRTCPDCGTPLSSNPKAQRCRPCHGKNSVWNRKQAEEALTNRDASATTARGRKLVKEQLKPACESCGTADRLHIHHVDRDPWNCQPSNLMTLCEPCHKDWHARHDHFGKDPFLHNYLDYDRIVSIAWVGVKRVYDLEMETPHHNFIANGFVSHNSGPMVGLNTAVVGETENTTELHPWKQFHYVADPAAPTALPIIFFQPSDNAASLLGVLEKAMQLADEVTAIPRYAAGSDRAGGAARTASGLAQLQGNVARLVRFVAKGIDTGVLTPVLSVLYDMKLLTDSSGLFRGDETIRPLGVQAAQKQEAERMRAMEMLQITANPIDAQLLGPDGRLMLLEEVAANLGFDEKKLASILTKRRKQLEQQGVDPTANPAATGNPPAAPSQAQEGPAAPIQGMMQPRSPEAIDRATGGPQRQ
jgi:hypothetical protein